MKGRSTGVQLGLVFCDIYKSYSLFHSIQRAAASSMSLAYSTVAVTTTKFMSDKNMLGFEIVVKE